MYRPLLTPHTFYSGALNTKVPLMAFSESLVEPIADKSHVSKTTPAGIDHVKDDYLGREELFGSCGFSSIDRPTPRRVVMRRDL